MFLFIWRMYYLLHLHAFTLKTEKSLLPKRQLKRGHEICTLPPINMVLWENGMSPILVSFHVGENFP